MYVYIRKHFVLNEKPYLMTLEKTLCPAFTENDFCSAAE